MTTVAAPSESLDCRDLVESVDAAELDGVDADRSSRGTASRASDGETLGEGDAGLCSGDGMLLGVGLGDRSYA